MLAPVTRLAECNQQLRLDELDSTEANRLEVADLDRGGLATPFTATTCAVTYLLAQPPPLGAAGALVLSAPPLAHGAAGAAVLSADRECPGHRPQPTPEQEGQQRSSSPP
jgi:hypothetical protein